MFTLVSHGNDKSCEIFDYIIQFVQRFYTTFFLRNFDRTPS